MVGFPPPISLWQHRFLSVPPVNCRRCFSVLAVYLDGYGLAADIFGFFGVSTPKFVFFCYVSHCQVPFVV